MRLARNLYSTLCECYICEKTITYGYNGTAISKLKYPHWPTPMFIWNKFAHKECFELISQNILQNDSKSHCGFCQESLLPRDDLCIFYQIVQFGKCYNFHESCFQVMADKETIKEPD